MSCIDLDLPYDSVGTEHDIDHFSSPASPRRSSISSIASENSVDAVLPRYPSSPSHTGSRRRSRSFGQPPPVPEEEPWPDPGEDFNAHHHGASPPASFADLSLSDDGAPKRPPARRQALPSPVHGHFHLPSQFHASPPPAAAAITVTVIDDPLVVKAALGDAIVVFRAPRSTPLADVRCRIHDRFARQEGLPLAHAFALAYAPPVPAAAAGGRARGSTMSSVSSVDATELLPIASQADWDRAVALCGVKIVLRVMQPSA